MCYCLGESKVKSLLAHLCYIRRVPASGVAKGGEAHSFQDGLLHPHVAMPPVSASCTYCGFLGSVCGAMGETFLQYHHPVQTLPTQHAFSYTSQIQRQRNLIPLYRGHWKMSSPTCCISNLQPGQIPFTQPWSPQLPNVSEKKLGRDIAPAGNSRLISV